MKDILEALGIKVEECCHKTWRRCWEHQEKNHENTHNRMAMDLFDLRSALRDTTYLLKRKARHVPDDLREKFAHQYEINDRAVYRNTPTYYKRYAELVEENENLQAENKALRKGLPVLKYYGDGSSWRWEGVDGVIDSDDVSSVMESDGDEYEAGGKRARQAYKEITEELEKLR